MRMPHEILSRSCLVYCYVLCFMCALYVLILIFSLFRDDEGAHTYHYAFYAAALRTLFSCVHDFCNIKLCYAGDSARRDIPQADSHSVRMDDDGNAPSAMLSHRSSREAADRWQFTVPAEGKGAADAGD